jgi:predicted small lipoprotein YifL
MKVLSVVMQFLSTESVEWAGEMSVIRFTLMLRQFRIAAAAIAVLAAAGCGIKGPLVLPPPAPPPAAKPASTPEPAAASATTPATTDPAAPARKP